MFGYSLKGTQNYIKPRLPWLQARREALESKRLYRAACADAIKWRVAAQRSEATVNAAMEDIQSSFNESRVRLCSTLTPALPS